MRIVRAPIAAVGAFFVAAGILLAEFGQSRASTTLAAFGWGYAAAGAVMIVLSLLPNRRP